jgi:hypothetical protein
MCPHISLFNYWHQLSPIATFGMAAALPFLLGFMALQRA